MPTRKMFKSCVERETGSMEPKSTQCRACDVRLLLRIASFGCLMTLLNEPRVGIKPTFMAPDQIYIRLKIGGDRELGGGGGCVRIEL